MMDMMKKYIAAVVSLALALLLLGAACAEESAAGLREAEMIEAGFFPVSEIMRQDGFSETAPWSYEKVLSDELAVKVSFDTEGGSCAKNQYLFDINGQFKRFGDELYLSKSAVLSILNLNAGYSGGELVLRPVAYEAREWTDVSRLIAHAGGAARDIDFCTFYTNSLDAFVENYNLGHRVFEFDFALTSDGGLACIHDWKSFGLKNGVALTSQEWLDFKAYGKPVTRGRYTTMLVGNLLDQMLVNRDVFLVTDTKSLYTSGENALLQFELIRDAAMARDPELLDRIVPQVYDASTYELIMSVYPWRSVIYTTYSDKKAAAETILDFAEQHDNIHVITARDSDSRFGKAEIDRIHGSGRLFYTHTLNTYEELVGQLSRGADGLYTDLLVMEDMERYYGAVARREAMPASDSVAPEDLYFLQLTEVAPSLAEGIDYATGLEDCDVLISVRGDVAGGLPDDARGAMARHGLYPDLLNAPGCGYCAVIANGEVVFEGGQNIQVAYAGIAEDGAEYAMESDGVEQGDASSILIKGKEFSLNKPGFNIVVYNTRLHTVVHQGVYEVQTGA